MLKIRHLFAAAVVGLSLTPYIAGGPAFAGSSGYERQLYSQAERGWQVDYIPVLNSCVLGRVHTDGTTLQIAIIPQGFSVMVTNEKWRNIKAGQGYRLGMVMDGGAEKWNGAATGVWTYDGSPGLFMPVGEAFMLSFVKRNRADLYNGQTGTFVTALALDGTAAGTVALIECQDAHGKPVPPPNAPAPSRPNAPEFNT
jgi:hypothetical protein